MRASLGLLNMGEHSHTYTCTHMHIMYVFLTVSVRYVCCVFVTSYWVQFLSYMFTVIRLYEELHFGYLHVYCEVRGFVLKATSNQLISFYM